MRLLVALCMAVTMLLPTTANAAPTPDFTNAGTTFTSTSLCDAPSCRYQWRYYRTTTPDRLGTTMGEGETITYALRPGVWAVVLKVSNAQVRGGVSVTKYVSV